MDDKLLEAYRQGFKDGFVFGCDPCYVPGRKKSLRLEIEPDGSISDVIEVKEESHENQA